MKIHKKNISLQKKKKNVQIINKAKLNELFGKPKSFYKSKNKFIIYKNKGKSQDYEKQNYKNELSISKTDINQKTRNPKSKTKRKKLNCPFCIKSKIGEQIDFYSKENSVKNIITDHFNKIIFDNLQINRFISKDFL